MMHFNACKLFFGFFAMVLGYTALSQTEVITPITHAPNRQDVSSFKLMTEPDTINLPIVDDFSYPSTVPTSRFWSDQKVFINSQFSADMPSVGLATFDGLDEFGRAYDLFRGGSDTLADVLSSHYLRLANNNGNIFLSFMYQPGGLGEAPDFQDSLVVEFWSPVDSAWEQVWSVGGDLPPVFQHAIIAVDQPRWLQNGFRFRFGAYGSLQGAFDVWNLDYVRLDRNRNATDTVFSDPAFVRPHPPLTSNSFTHIPWFHYTRTRLRDNMELVYNRRGPSQNYSINLGFYTINKDGTQIASRTNPPVINDPGNLNINFFMPLNNFDINPLPTDEFVLDMKSWFTGTAVGLPGNDTVRLRQEFRNYYAFDDGTAERAYGVRNAGGAEIAMLFQPHQADTLKGVYFNFVQAGEDASNRGFQIGIWENDNGEPGDLIYMTDSVYFPDYGFNYNDFVPYILDNEGVFISGSVFIGTRQAGIFPLNMGFDRNNVNRTPLYYSNGNFWYQSILSGTVMMRPFFNYLPRDLATTNAVLPKLKARVAPNPSDGRLQLLALEPDANISVKVVGISGQELANHFLGNLRQLDVSHLPAGIYFLQIINEDGKSLPATIKISIQP